MRKFSNADVISCRNHIVRLSP